MRPRYLKIVGCMVLILALLGWYGYNHFLKPDPKITQQLNDQFGTQFFNSSANEPVVVHTSITAAVLDKIQANQSSPQAATSVNGNVSPAPITEEAIIQKYTPRFQSLESQASSHLDALVAAALQEYHQQKQDGTVNLAELARKYIQAGNMLEANEDGQFNSLVNAMQAELVADNQSTAIIADIRQEYAAAKAKKRAELMAKARR